jgi:hypothetical protein
MLTNMYVDELFGLCFCMVVVLALFLFWNMLMLKDFSNMSNAVNSGLERNYCI